MFEEQSELILKLTVCGKTLLYQKFCYVDLFMEFISYFSKFHSGLNLTGF